MIIRTNNGQAFEAVLLSRTGDSMRIALQGSEDVVELNQVHGKWVSEDCEVVQIEFAWESQRPAATVTEDDCICSHELAARLIHLLVSGENAPEAAKPFARRAAVLPVYQHVV